MATVPPMHAALSVLGTMAGQYLAAQSAQAQAAQAAPAQPAPQRQPTTNTSYTATHQATTSAANLCDVRMPCVYSCTACMTSFLLCRFATRSRSTSMDRRRIRIVARLALRRCRTRVPHRAAVRLGGARAQPARLLPATNLQPVLMPTCVTYVTSSDSVLWIQKLIASLRSTVTSSRSTMTERQPTRSVARHVHRRRKPVEQ